MPRQDVDLTEQEIRLFQEVQKKLGFSTIEQTIEYLLSQRLKKRLLALAGRDVRRKRSQP